MSIATMEENAYFCKTVYNQLSDHRSSNKTNVSQQTQNTAYSREMLDSQESIHFRRHSQNKKQWRHKDYGRIDKNMEDYGRIDKNMEEYGRVDEQQNEKSSKNMTPHQT